VRRCASIRCAINVVSEASLINLALARLKLDTFINVIITAVIHECALHRHIFTVGQGHQVHSHIAVQALDEIDWVYAIAEGHCAVDDQRVFVVLIAALREIVYGSDLFGLAQSDIEAKDLKVRRVLFARESDALAHVVMINLDAMVGLNLDAMDGVKLGCDGGAKLGCDGGLNLGAMTVQ